MTKQAQPGHTLEGQHAKAHAPLAFPDVPQGTDSPPLPVTRPALHVPEAAVPEAAARVNGFKGVSVEVIPLADCKGMSLIHSPGGNGGLEGLAVTEGAAVKGVQTMHTPGGSDGLEALEISGAFGAAEVDACTPTGGSDGRKGPSYLGPSEARRVKPHSISGTLNVPETTAGLDALTLDGLSVTTAGTLNVPAPMLDLLQQSAVVGAAWCDRLDADQRTASPQPQHHAQDDRRGSDVRVRARLLGWYERQGQ